jgi:hypothetical protein
MQPDFAATLWFEAWPFVCIGKLTFQR